MCKTPCKTRFGLLTLAFTATEAQMQKRYGMFGKFAAYAPHFTGPSTAEESIKLVMNVIQNASVEKDAGSAVSHFGNKQWL